MSSMPSPESLLPDPDEMYNHIISQLAFLEGQGGQIARNQEYFRLARSNLEQDEPENWKLDIHPNWVVRISTPEHLSRSDSARDFAIEEGYAIIGGIIQAEDNEFTEYSLHLTLLARRDSEVRGEDTNAPCCWDHSSTNTEWRVAKRYHFDIDLGRNSSEAKPITHLQSGGNFKSDMLPAGIDPDAVHYCSTPLDKPRLPHPPMDPILLFQIVADQYGSPPDLVSEHWEPRVIEAESKLWTDYYSRVSEHLDRGDRSNPFDLFISNGRIG